MSYSVELTQKAEDDLSRLPKRQAQLTVNRLRRLGENAETVSHRALAGQLRGVLWNLPPSRSVRGARGNAQGGGGLGVV